MYTRGDYSTHCVCTSTISSSIKHLFIRHFKCSPYKTWHICHVLFFTPSLKPSFHDLLLTVPKRRHFGTLTIYGTLNNKITAGATFNLTHSAAHQTCRSALFAQPCVLSAYSSIPDFYFAWPTSFTIVLLIQMHGGFFLFLMFKPSLFYM